ncbi:MAG TPA: universal stress protein [Prolixibacteraceae bacterium]|nr:universal stress protein [Prolixibacteraceae bacterium]
MGVIRNINKILVSLDLTAIDANMIEYASFLSRTLKIDKIYFVHAIQAYELGRKEKKLDEIRRTLNQNIRDEIDNIVNHRFGEKTKTEVITRIEDENAAQGVLDVIREKEIDLTLIGLKYGEDREGKYAKEISAKAGSDLLLVPEEAENKIEHIFCAVDFSEESEEAFQKALDLSKTNGARLSCYYVYDIRKVYFPGATDQSLATLEKKFNKKYEKFLSRFDLHESDVTPRFNANEKLDNSAEKIYNQAYDDKADLIIVGTKGQVGSVISLLGNITENLIHIDTEIPVMIIKNHKKKNRWSMFRR